VVRGGVPAALVELATGFCRGFQAGTTSKTFFPRGVRLGWAGWRGRTYPPTTPLRRRPPQGTAPVAQAHSAQRLFRGGRSAAGFFGSDDQLELSELSAVPGAKC